ncbi:MAG: hypothetical protein KBT34_07005 [Prevotella sp.]|nr:hypothetical protein [Candidatus Prevotella equi]
MITLDVDKINQHSPYKVYATSRTSTLEFFTDYDVHYAIDFIEDDLIQSAKVYQFGIANVDNVKSPRDWKVRDTIISIIENFFLENQRALLYICETGDGKQSMRSRLFRSWYDSSVLRDEIVFLSASIPDEEGIVNYASLMIPLFSDDLEAVVNEFRTTVEMFRNK